MNENKSIFHSAERLLASRMHSIHELQEKLQRKFPKEKKKIKEVLLYFQTHKILNDREYAQAYVDYQQTISPKSISMLRNILKKKGVLSEIIEDVLQKKEINEDVIAKSFAKKKFLSLVNTMPLQKKKERIYRHLMTKGFSYSVCRNVTEEVFNEKE